MKYRSILLGPLAHAGIGSLVFCWFSKKKPIKSISVKVDLILTDSKFIDNVSSVDVIKGWLVS